MSFFIINIAHFPIPKLIPISLLKTWTFRKNEFSSFSLMLCNIKSVINRRWVIFHCIQKINKLPWPLLKSNLMELILEQKLSDTKNLFTLTIPSTLSNSEFPVHNVTLHFSTLLTNKVLIFTVTPNVPKQSDIYKWGALLETFL